MIVRFCSARPLAFTATIDFLDADGRRFGQPVTACADNSLLTHVQYYALNRKALTWKGEGDRPGQLLVLPSYRLLPQAEALGPLKVAPALLKYLNATTARGPFTNLPRQLSANAGKVFYELVELVSGRPLVRPAVKNSTNRTEVALSLVNSYDGALAELRKQARAAGRSPACPPCALHLLFCAQPTSRRPRKLTTHVPETLRTLANARKCDNPQT